jgi:hypothetical protein
MVFEHIIGRNIFTRLDEAEQLLPLILGKIAPQGTFTSAETIPSLGSRLSHIATDPIVKKQLADAENEIYGSNGNPMARWSVDDLLALFTAEKITVTSHLVKAEEHRHISKQGLDRWIERSYTPAWKKLQLEVDADYMSTHLQRICERNAVPWQVTVAIIVCSK